MSKRILYKERIKTIALVVLFLTAVLLSYLYWRDSSIQEIRQTVDNRLSFSTLSSQTVPGLAEFVCPDSIAVNFGDGTYTDFQENAAGVWEQLLPCYIEFTKTRGLSIEKISARQWSNIMSFPSVQCTFDYPLPDSYFRARGAAGYGESDAFSYVTTLGFSRVFDDSFFIRSNREDGYYRIRSASADNQSVLSMIEEWKTASPDAYYPMDQFLGTDNTVITPFSTRIELPALQLRTTPTADPETFETALARNFFGQGMDFIRTVTDNSGTTVYMYSYGQTTLTVYPNGFFEYQDTPSANDKVASFPEAFQIASQFIAAHGAWSAHDGKTLHYLLEDVSRDTYNKSSVYTLRFRSHYGGQKIYGSDNVLTIVVTGNQVTYYSRNLLIPGEEDFTAVSEEDAANYPFVDVVSRNYETIAEELTAAGLWESSAAGNDLFDAVLEQITAIQTGYYEVSQNRQKTCRPSWILCFSDAKVFFDLYTGEYLGILF